MNETIFQIPATMQDVRLTRHRGAIVKVESQEELPDAMISRLASLTGKEGFFTFNVEQIKPDDLLDLPEMPKINKKSPSQAFRQLLWRIAEHEGVPEEKRDDFYLEEMRKIYATYQYRLEEV